MSASDQSADPTIRTYKVRWFFLGLLVVLNAINNINATAYGQVNDVFQRYFGVSFAQVDWLTLTGMAVVIVSSPLLAFLSYKEWINLRGVICGACMFVTLAYSLLSLAMAEGLYAVALVGQCFTGVATAILLATPPVFAVTWFPNDEISTAVSLGVFGLSLGELFGDVVPANVLPLQKVLILNSTALEFWKTGCRESLMLIFLPLTATAMVTATLFLIFLPNKPDLPPSHAQAAKDEKIRMNGHGNAQPNFNNKIHRERGIGNLCSLTLIFINIAFGILVNMSAVEYTMMAEIIEKVKFDGVANINSDVLGGYLMVPFAVGGLLGCLSSAKVLHKFQRLKIQATVGAVSCVLSSFGLALGFVYNSFWGLAAANGLLGFSVRFTSIALYNIATEHVYPVNEAMVCAILVGSQALMGVLSGVLGRIVYNQAGGFWVLVMEASGYLLATLLIVASSPDLNRQKAEATREKRGTLTEVSRLIDK